MTGEPFITAFELGAYLARGDLSGDVTAEAACAAASDTCRTTADQLFDYVEDDEITLDGPGTDVLILPQVPVVDVTSVINSDGNEVTSDWVLTQHGTLINLDGNWTKGRQNFTVTYSHGFQGDASDPSGDAGFPHDLCMVALALAGRIYMQGPTVFESIGKRQVRYAGPAMDLSNTERAILRKYKQTM